MSTTLVQEDLKQELQASREKHMELLRAHSEQISTTERGIYEAGRMLEQVSMENSRLHLVRQSLTSFSLS